MDNDYAFFSFNDDNANRNYDGYKSSIYKDYMEYVKAEDDLEAMIKDGILDIFVDINGVFEYYPSSKTIESLGSFASRIKPKPMTFAQMLERRNLNINRYIRYKQMLRRGKP